ncbi:aminoglycoside phosphotransferase family protein [Propionibacteriaceae bacterium Y1685]|uniref:aminoglycoside phosphotransferase family protein n=1 Tax=Microlunatus sp. Y1700 TaxID=3418487 RepID=UPI003B7E2A4F
MAKLHHDEVDIDEALVRRLLAEQQPELIIDELIEVEPAGTDNRNFRLTSGHDQHLVRLPRKEDAAPGIAKEARFGHLLAPLLPVDIPVPTQVGAPGHGYPFAWSLSPWLPGELPVPGEASKGLAEDLAEFVRALRSVDTRALRGDPMLTSYRVNSIESRFAATQEFLPRCTGWADVEALTRAWQLIKDTTPYDGPPALAHTDLQPGNVLVDDDGRLSAVIDFGGLALGDPTIDLLPAWHLLGPTTRPTFRQALAVDDATWQRGMAWAMTIGVVALGYYAGSDSPLVRRSQYQLEQVLLDLS